MTKTSLSVDPIGIPCCVYKAKFKNLAANTQYKIYLSNELSAWFKTGGENSSLLFGGDSRSDSYQRRKINEQIQKTFIKNPEIIALVHGGDYVHNGFK